MRLITNSKIKQKIFTLIEFHLLSLVIGGGLGVHIHGFSRIQTCPVPVKKDFAFRHGAMMPVWRDVMTARLLVAPAQEVVFGTTQIQQQQYPLQQYPFKTLYVFDEKLNKWFELSDEKQGRPDMAVATMTPSRALGYMEFVECQSMPHLYVSTAVIGSRTLGEVGRKQMKEQFKSTVQSYLYPHRMSEEAYWEEVEKTRLTFEKMSIEDDVEEEEDVPVTSDQ